MSDKIKQEFEYIIKASNKILYQAISSPSGLSEWFCDDVNINKDGIYTFMWNDSEEEAKLLSNKSNEYVKFQWLDDEGTKNYFELRIKIDDMYQRSCSYCNRFFVMMMKKKKTNFFGTIKFTILNNLLEDNFLSSLV